LTKQLIDLTKYYNLVSVINTPTFEGLTGENKNGIIKESFRVLREGGMLVFVDWLKEADFGPARGWRLGKEEAKAMIEKEGFVFKKEIGAGAFHFGMVFSK